MRQGNKQLVGWRWAKVVLLLFGLLLLARPAFAQSGPPQVAVPPVRTTIDGNGVDLYRGALSFSQTYMSLGSNGIGASYARTWVGNGSGGVPGWRDTLVGGINQTGAEYTVTIGDSSESFTQSGAAFVNDQGSGSTLDFDSGTGLYTYTTTDGTVAKFDHNLVNPGINQYSIYAANTGLITQLTRIKNAFIVTYDYETDTFCVHMTLGTCDAYAQAIRLSDLQTTSGYRLQLHHVRDAALPPFPGPALAALPDWLTPASVTGESMIDCVPTYCPTPATPFPVVTLSSAASGTDTIWTIADPMSRQWRYDVDANNNLVGIFRPTNTGSTANMSISYYGSGAGFSAGRVQTYAQDGRTWSYQYNEDTTAHTVTTIICDPSIATASCSSTNYTQTYVFDETTTQPTSVVQTTDYSVPTRSTYTYAYDTYGRLTTAQAPEGNFTTYGYDSYGNVASTVTTPKGSTDTACGSGHNTICTSATFPHCPGINCASPGQTIDANGNSTFYIYDGLHGYLTKVEYPATSPGNGLEIDYTYTNFYAYYLNSSGVIATSGSPIILLTKTTQCRTALTCSGTANETVTTYNYADGSSPTVGNNLNLLTQSSGAGDGSLTATTTMTYDHIGNMTSVDGPLPGTDDTTVNFYDADRELVGSIGPAPGLSSGLPNRAVRLTYNDDGQVTIVEKGTTSGQTSSAWAAFTPLEQANSLYGSDGLKTSDQILDFATSGHPAFVETDYNYDAVGRPLCTAVRLQIPSSAADACSLSSPASGYGSDRITKVTYDAANRAIVVQQAYGVTGQQIDYATSTYTPNGNLLTLKDANTNVTTYTYDGFDRPDKTQYPNPSGGGSSSTDYQENAVYDANSNVTSFRLRDGNTVSMSYDAANRLTGRSGATVAARTFTYDNFNQLTGSTLTGGISVSFGYDALGRVTTETSPLGTMTTGYDLAGRRTTLAWPDRFSATYVRYATGDLYYFTENTGYEPVVFYYDGLGHLTGIGKANGRAQGFGWDSADRLTYVGTTLSGGVSYGNLSYNPASQIYSRSTSDEQLSANVAYNVNRSYAANGLNQYTKAGAPGVAYDGNANLTRLASNTYAYDGDNLLTGGRAGTGLTYDPLNRLYQVPDDGGTRFAYSGGMIVGEYDSAGNLKRRYVPGDGADNPLVWYEGSGTSDRRYLATDERGSITEVSNDAGTTLAINQYDDWGMPAAGNLGRFGYTGQTWLPSVQAWNYKARIYNPIVGRFHQTDPIGYQADLNHYRYVANQPLNLVDPLGLCLQATDDGIVISVVQLYKGVCNPAPTPGVITNGSVPDNEKDNTAMQSPQSPKPKPFTCADAMTQPGKIKTAGITVSAVGLIGMTATRGSWTNMTTGAHGMFTTFGFAAGVAAGAGPAGQTYSSMAAFTGMSDGYSIGAGVGVGPISVGGSYASSWNDSGSGSGASVDIGSAGLPFLSFAASWTDTAISRCRPGSGG